MVSTGDKVFLGVFFTLITGLCAFGLGSSTYSWGNQRAVRAHLQAVFQEQVDHHKCKVTPYWKDGKAISGDLCILPDGTILMTAVPPKLEVK